jgi:hypothetical protein
MPKSFQNNLLLPKKGEVITSGQRKKASQQRQGDFEASCVRAEQL